MFSGSSPDQSPSKRTRAKLGQRNAKDEHKEKAKEIKVASRKEEQPKEENEKQFEKLQWKASPSFWKFPLESLDEAAAIVAQIQKGEVKIKTEVTAIICDDAEEQD